MSDYLNKMNGQSLDHDMYQEAEHQGNLEGYEAYLKKYPNGMWAKEAKQNISTLKAKKQREDEESQREWESRQKEELEKQNTMFVLKIVAGIIVVILLYASGVFSKKVEEVPAVAPAPAVEQPAPETEAEVPESSANLQEYWYDVSEQECTNGGGEMKQGVCKANWEKAGQICSSLGGRLPTIYELRNVVTECGGVVGDHENNKNNKAYQSCYKNKGFSSNAYWSSTTDASDTSNAWFVYFNDSYDDAVTKTGSGYVRCVRAGQ